MRPRKMIVASVALATAAWVAAPAFKVAAAPLFEPPAADAASCPTCPMGSMIAAEASRLRQALLAAVPQDRLLAPSRYGLWIGLAEEGLANSRIAITRPQLLVVVNRNPAVQRLAVVLADPQGPWRVVGGSKVSTGQAGRLGYFITPLGVFLHNGEIRDYRALGTLNEHGIRGLGVKGMRVWDFGWQEARRGWEPGRGEIRLLMHATDPTYLAPRLGRPASKGCIRIPAAMNRFLDLYGVLDREYDALASDYRRYRDVLPADGQPTILAGDKLLVVDSRMLVASGRTRRGKARLALILRRRAALKSAPTTRSPRPGGRAPDR